MKIVIVGAKDRNTDEDKALVEELVDLAAKTYPNCVFVTMLTHEGVGLFVKQKCLEKGSNSNFKFQLIEVNLRLYAKQLSKSEVSQIYLARNATMFELADMLIYLANNDRRGMIEDLVLNRIVPSGRPYIILLPSEKAKLPDFSGGGAGA